MRCGKNGGGRRVFTFRLAVASSSMARNPAKEKPLAHQGGSTGERGGTRSCGEGQVEALISSFIAYKPKTSTQSKLVNRQFESGYCMAATSTNIFRTSKSTTRQPHAIQSNTAQHLRIFSVIVHPPLCACDSVSALLHCVHPART